MKKVARLVYHELIVIEKCLCKVVEEQRLAYFWSILMKNYYDFVFGRTDMPECIVLR